MSSYVIDKKEYIKCAGYIAGLQEAKNRFNESSLYLYNNAVGRLYSKQDIIYELFYLLKANTLSVCVQYNDYQEAKNLYDFLEPTEEEKALFNEYIAKGKKAAFNPEALLDIILYISDFIDCFHYQTSSDLSKDGLIFLRYCLSRIASRYRDLNEDYESTL